MRFGYENLFDSIQARLKPPKHYFSLEDDKEMTSLKPISHRRHSLFSHSSFMTESDFLHVADDGRASSSSANHTNQAIIRSETSSPLASRKRPLEPDGCIFVGSFDRLSAEDQHNLEEIYRKRQGKRPSKREIKLYSSVYGIPQCKIKRWFDGKLGALENEEEHALRQQVAVSQSTPEPIASNYVPIYPRPESDPEISAMLGELEENASQLEELNTAIGNFIAGLLN